MGQLVPDPNFNDPAAWSITTHEGSAVVSGGVLTCTGWRGSISTTIDAPVIGTVYGFYIDVTSVVPNGLVAVQYGGIDGGLGGPVLWTGAQGSGVFSGSGAATDTTDLSISVAFTASDLIINRLQVFELHARQIIREAAAGIVTGLTTTGANVFQSRVYNVQESELPCLLVYTVSEPGAEVQTITTPRRLVREVELIIEGKAKGATDMDDTLDDIAEEVETAISADNSLGIGAVDTIIAGTEIDYTSEGDQPIGSVIMRYAVTYIVNENAPGTLL